MLVARLPMGSLVRRGSCSWRVRARARARRAVSGAAGAARRRAAGETKNEKDTFKELAGRGP